MNVTRQKQTRREAASGYQWGKGSREGQNQARGLRRTNHYA